MHTDAFFAVKINGYPFPNHEFQELVLVVVVATENPMKMIIALKKKKYMDY